MGRKCKIVVVVDFNLKNYIQERDSNRTRRHTRDALVPFSGLNRVWHRL